MGSDVEFFGQLTGTKAKREAWRRASVDAKSAPKSALKGRAKRFRRSSDDFTVTQLLDDVTRQGAVEEAGRSLRLGGMIEQGLFWEGWSAELAKALVVAARLGLEGWLWVVHEEERQRLRLDGNTVVVEAADATAWKKAQRSAAHALVDHAVDADVKAAVDAAMDRWDHGSAATSADAFEAVLAALETVDDKKVTAALGKCGDVPSKKGRERPKKLFKNKAGLITAARGTKVAEQQGCAVEVLSRVDVKRCTPLALRLATEKPKKTAPALRAAAITALGRSAEDRALEALLKVVFGTIKGWDLTDPVIAAVHALAASKHPEAGKRALEAMPKLKGRRGDACFNRVVYAILERRDRSMRSAMEALRDDPKSPHSYIAGVAVSLLDAGHSGNFRALATQR